MTGRWGKEVFDSGEELVYNGRKKKEGACAVKRYWKLLPAALALLLLLGCAGKDRQDTPEMSEPSAQQELVPEREPDTVSDPEPTREVQPEPDPEPQPEPATEQASAQEPESEEKMTMQLKIGDTPLSVSWEDNAAVQALEELCAQEPLTISMTRYGGFEQVGPIGQTLPREDAQTTTQPGDLVLYSGDQLVVFYGSNRWAYTRLGHITDATQEELSALLKEDTTITLYLGE